MLHQHSSASQQIAKFPFFYSKRPFFFAFSAKYSPDLGRRDDDGLGVSGRGHQPAAPLHPRALTGVIVGHRHLEHICIYKCVFVCVSVIVGHRHLEYICIYNCVFYVCLSPTASVFINVCLYVCLSYICHMYWQCSFIGYVISVLSHPTTY